MNIDDWTALGSIATGIGSFATFLTILVTILLYRRQSRANKAAAIRQSRDNKAAAIRESRDNKAAAIRESLQFIHSRQTQVTRSIESGFLATIERQIRQFRQSLGSTAEPSYFLDQLFGNGQDSDDRSLFRASALGSNLSSTMYIRMSDIWDGMNMKAFELRGALRIFSYVSLVMTEEARDLCAPDNTTCILRIMAEHGARETLCKIRSLDELVNELLSGQIKLASRQLEKEQNKLRQACSLIGRLADDALRLSDEELLKLAEKKVRQLGFEDLFKDPPQAIKTSLGDLRPTFLEKELNDLCKIVDCWFSELPNTVPAESHPPEKALPDSRR
jgi:hypothetical protein